MKPIRKAAIKRQLRPVLDAALVALLLLQMGYQLVPEDLHAILGIAMALVAAAHLALNASWVRALGRGRWNVARVLMTLAASASLLLMVSLTLSGFVLSGRLDALRPLDGIARAAHLSSSYLALLILPLHAGIHATGALRHKKNGEAGLLHRLGLALWVAASCLGAYEFAALRVLDYVTLRMPFVLPAKAPLPVYLVEHASIMALCALAGALLMRSATHRARPVLH